MKQFLTLLLLVGSHMLCDAQATTLMVDNQTPGWLSSKINYGDQQTVEDLVISGYINGTDIDFLRSLNIDRNLRGCIDLRNVTIVKGGTMTLFPYTVEKDNELPYKCFSDLKSLRKLIYPKRATSGGWALINTPCDTVIITNDTITSLCLRDYVYPTSKEQTKYVYIPDGVEFLPDLPENAYNMGIRFPSSIKSITGYGGMSNARIFAEMLNPEIIISEYHAYTGTSSGGWYSKYPAIKQSTIYVPKGLLERYKESALGNNQIIEYYDLEGLSYPETLDLYVDDIYTLDVKALPNNNLVSYYLFSSSNQEVATVDSEGKITAITHGTCSIDITTQMVTHFSNGDNGICNINVYSHVTGISIEESLTLGVDESKTLAATLYPINETNNNIIWESSNPEIAFVDDNGTVTGRSKDSCAISATSIDGNFSSICQVSVVTPVENIVVTPNSTSVKVGESISLSARIYPEDAHDKGVIWSSSDESIATVNIDGSVTALSPGLVRIYAISNYNNDIRDVCEVTILQSATGISLNQSEIELVEDESSQIIATVLPENASNKNVNWMSSDVSVAMVSPDGTVYAIKPGQATIMATTVDGGFVALCKVTVKAKVILATAIRLSHTSKTIAVGETLQLNAVLEPENVTNNNINWISTNTNVATVNSTGLIQAVAQGSTEIIATTTDESNLSAICKIIVEKPFIEITQIHISPSSARIPVGKSVKLNAIVTPDDATSTNVLWSTTNASVAAVSQDGNVEAISEGEAVIIASTQDGSNLSSTCNISVYNNIVLISEIILNPVNIAGGKNEVATINAVIIPENATNKQLRWYSSNDNVAVVNDGVVKLVKQGTAIITAEALDGSNVKSECAVVVYDNVGIESIIEDKNTAVKIFNLSGNLIYQGNYAESNIEPGIYIVLYNGKSFKAKID